MKLANFAKTIAAAAIAATSLTTSASAGYYSTNSYVHVQTQTIYVPTPRTRCYMEEVYDHYSGRYFVERRCNTHYR